ncbi:alpha/beta hydrolase [Corynebacterium lubricantis]|uniref:alpha/beta hydrolase n=1 Tax=Corynebacterium lubricantis TaxID=541095 RepID=UPI000378140E|nr:alpha/beta hydrolase family protein [Corynebacterium lubricantis]
MKLKRSVLAAGAAIAIALGAAPVAQSATVTPAEVAGNAAVGTVRPMTSADVPNAVTTGAPQQWYADYVDGDKVEAYIVTSPSMNNREIPVAVIPARDADGNRVDNAPTVYMLNGAGGAEQDADWLRQTEGLDFYQNKGVNVVIPQAGAFSYYMDWEDDVNTRYLQGGPQKWETFITKELPGPIEAELGANNQRATVGFSMSATSSLLHAQHNPGFYDAVGSFSGCAATSTFNTYEYMRLTVNRGGSEPENMVGPMGSRHNRHNDALLSAHRFQDTNTKLYVSTGTGLAGETDMAGYYRDRGMDATTASAQAGVLQVEGGVIEAAMNQCTHDLKAKTDSLGMADRTHYELRNTGTHSWPSWREDLELSWTKTIKPAFGL